MIRFHQSQAKVLLTDCPAELKHQMDRGRVATRAMDAGSLLDYLVFGQDQKYEIVDARDKNGDVVTDWRTDAAKGAREEVAALGKLAVLQHEYDAANESATRIMVRLYELQGRSRMFMQPTVQWQSELGVECEGTPDVVFIDTVTHPDFATLIRVVDVKRTTAINPLGLKRQIQAMCWDVQAAAYKEAATEHAYQQMESGTVTNLIYQGHTILACQSGGREAIRAYPLSEVSMELGRRRWEKAQKQWQECLASDYWPDYPEDPIEPPRYAVRELLGNPTDGDDLSDLGLTP